MAEKLYAYQGFTGRIHEIRDEINDRYALWKHKNPGGVVGWFKGKCFQSGERSHNKNVVYQDFSHIYRKKTRKELVRVSAAVMGIEFSYAAETAFVSPTLLKIGVEHKHMTLVWALSPLLGFFVTPILGSLSDRCPLNFGRRRPFILLMSFGVLLGLILVPNGEKIGYIMGDPRPPNASQNYVASHRTTASNNDDNSTQIINTNLSYNNSHPWGIFFTILGTVLLDFDADACQSPARSYLLDVTVSDDHARGLSTFTIMAGLGGFFGYALGGINWDATSIGVMLGGHVKAVFTLITIIFVICVAYTVTSFREMPLHILEVRANIEIDEESHRDAEEEGIAKESCNKTYGSLGHENYSFEESEENFKDQDVVQEIPEERRKSIAPDPDASFLIYLQSIIYMPHSIKMLCLTNLFCWMAHVCYSLYFTDFVGEAVFKGNPTAPEGTETRELYESGVRFGCWGMSMYSLSCACYSVIIERLIAKFRAKKVYVGGLLIYSTGMCLMALTKHKVGVILFSWTAGVMYSTLFTMPYLLVAHYHAKGTFEVTNEGEEKVSSQIRGLGTDVALVSSMVFLAQFILSVCMGTIVSISGTTTAVVSVASFLAFCGSLAATRVMYLDL